MRLPSLALFALVACGGDKGDTSGTNAGIAGSPTTGSVAGTPGGSTSPFRTATLNGTLHSCDGSGLADAQIRFCDPDVCRNQVSGADGTFTYTETKYGWNSFEAIAPAGSGLTTAFVPLEFADGETRTVDLTLCPHGPTVALTGTATEVEHGTGLHITVSTTLLEKPTPFDDDPTETTGQQVDPAHWVPTDGITGTVAAQWFLEPFNYKATAAGGLDYRVDGPTVGLAAASYHVYIGSYDDFAWLDGGTISDADADGWYTPDGDGLPHLGTVLLVEE